MAAYYQNQVLRGDVPIDNSSFVGCKFEGARLIYGGGDFSMEKCHIIDCELSLVGPAQATLHFLRGMANQKGGAELVEFVFPLPFTIKDTETE